MRIYELTTNNGTRFVRQQPTIDDTAAYCAEWRKTHDRITYLSFPIFSYRPIDVMDIRTIRAMINRGERV